MRYRYIPLFCVLLVANLDACRKSPRPPVADSLMRAYDIEQDSNDPHHSIPLQYEQAQGRRIFVDKCIWCHADATPAGPSNRSNLTPQPPLLSDGNVMNSLSDGFIRNIVTLGGSALGKSPMMPPWGNTLNEEDIRAVTAYVRAVAEPRYQAPARFSSDYGVK
jgi:cytochrome c